MPQHLTTRLVIIGGGPAGLTAAIYAGRANLEPVIVSGGFLGGSMIPGGQLMITTEVENYPGFPEGVTGPDLMEKMQKQAAQFGAYEITEFATGFKFKPGGPHLVTLEDGSTIVAHAVILAMGAQARWLGAKGEQEFVNHGVSACATCDGPLPKFKDQDIYVVGGGDSAVEEAMFLSKFGRRVYMLVRRDVLRASKIMQARAVQNEKIEIVWNTELVEYHGEGEGKDLTHITLRSTTDGKTRKVPATGVFMAIGHDPCTRALQSSGVSLNEAGYVNAVDHVRTSVEGVFTAGDIHDTHYKQAVTAAGFGCMASIAAERWLEMVQLVEPPVAEGHRVAKSLLKRKE